MDDEGFGFGGKLLDGLFGVVGKKIDQQTAAEVATANSKETWANNDPRLAVDEYGRPYLRGAPSSTLAVSSLGVSPTVLIGGAVAVAVLLFVLLKK